MRPTLTIARELLGKHLVRMHKGAALVGRIVEVEAYRGRLDPASHAYHGRTRRNEVMFREGGHLYVYFTYGMHFCANVVTAKEGVAEAVLIRALEPLEGIELMRRNRFGNRPERRDDLDTVNLTNGPAKLCQALAIQRKENGTDLTKGEIYILHSSPLRGSQIGKSVRIGITNGREKKWRFYIKGNAWVSR